MVHGKARNLRITAASLIAALHLGVITCLFLRLLILLGLIPIWNGFTFWCMAEKGSTKYIRVFGLIVSPAWQDMR